MIHPDGLRRARLYLAGMWAGGALLVAVAAAALNRFVADRVEFGNAVSGLFRKEAWVGLACGLLLLAFIGMDNKLDARRRRTLLIVTLAMLACIAGYFGLQPVMAALRESAGAGGVMASGAKSRFGMLHGVSMLLYLVKTVLALFLVWKCAGASRSSAADTPR